MTLFENSQYFRDKIRLTPFPEFIFKYQDLLKELNAYLECIKDNLHEDRKLKDLLKTARFYSSAITKISQDFRVKSLQFEKEKNGKNSL